MNALITLRVRFNKFRDRLGLFLIAFTLVALTITGCASAPSHDQDIALNLPNEPLVFQYELIMRNGKVISDEEIAADSERVNTFPTHRRFFLCNNLRQLDADRGW